MKWNNGLKQISCCVFLFAVLASLPPKVIAFSGRDTLEKYQQALANYKASGNQAGIIYTSIQLGDIYLEREEYHKALAFYKATWPEGEARTIGKVGLVYIRFGDYQKAFQYTQAALSIEQAEGDPQGEATYLTNLGVIYMKVGAYEKAIETFETVLSITQDIDLLTLKATALNNLGEAYQHLSNYQKALDYLFQSLSIRRKLDRPKKQVNTLIAIGTVYMSVEDYQNALEHFNEALNLSQKEKFFLGEALALNSLSTIFGKMGRYGVAIAYLQAALAIERQLDIPEGEATLHLNIGSIYHKLGEYALALDNYNKALSIFRKIGYRLGEAHILINIGHIYNDLGNSEKAIEYKQQALSKSQIIGYTAGEVTALYDIGLVYEKKGDYRKSFEYYSKAIAIVEKVREDLKIEALRSVDILQVSNLYEHAIFALLKRNKSKEAFNYAERSRARTFLDLLGNQQIRPKSSENLQLIEEERQLLAEITTLKQHLNQEGIAAPDKTFHKNQNLILALETKRKEYEDLLVQLQLSNPEYATLVSVNPLNVEKVQELLHEQAPQTTLISYFVGAEETAIFVISSNSFHAQTISVNRDELRRQSEHLRAQMKRNPILSNSWQEPALLLYSWLFKPIEKYLPNASVDAPSFLGIIPHNILHYLPFNVLFDGEHTVLEKHVLFHVPSASSLQFILPKGHPESDKVLVIAQPEAPQTPYLYHAVEEAQAVASLYSTTALIDREATESQFKALAGEYRMIHIAAHSDYVPQAPLFSAILLGEDEAEDGRLATHEIFNLDLSNADLVVLSACETHLGKWSRGDELVGLERAFMRAGTHALLSTLWSVDDTATGELMQQFYTHLQMGFSKGEALRLAQLGLKEKYPDPYYWSGFMLVGDHGAPYGKLKEKEEQNRIILGMAILMLVMTGLFWLIRNKA